MKFIPVNKPLLTKSDLISVNKTFKSGWISSSGKEIINFEKNFSTFVGHKYGIAVANGTAALDIAVKLANLKKGDEIIIPNFTIISNALPAIKEKIKLKVVDCDKKDWNLNLENLKKKITKNTKVIIATHIYNFPCRVDIIRKICDKKKILLIEDCAEAVGQKINNKKCGSFGHVSIFSFYANKQITTGEGGMLTTNSRVYCEKAKSLRNLSFGKKNRFDHSDIGWNYRITNVQASLGNNQLKRINKIVKKRHENGQLYYERLKKNKNIFIQPPKNKISKNIYWVIAILITNKQLKIDALKASKILRKYGIETRPFFWPMHKQKILKNYNFYRSNNYKNSDYISKYGFYLPSSLDIKVSEINYICKIVNKIFVLKN
jgi:perosamine synthetase